MQEFDAIVIGAGSGLDVAAAYASRGKQVAIVEPGPLGGTCLNRGCIPSKMLIHYADVATTVKDSEKFHIDAEINGVDFPTIVEEVNSEIESDAEAIENGIAESDNHTLFRAEAEFVDEKTLRITGENEQITADTIFVAAGTRPLVPPIHGIEKVDYITSREALKLDEQPERLVIIGGGYIAVELAHFFHGLGTEVTILEMQDRLVGREDIDISEKFTGLASEKYNVNLGLKASKVEEVGDQIKVLAKEEDGNKHSVAGD
jgi:dihydrolipoamide dehydrogenase